MNGDDTPELANGGLSAPVFNGTTVTFQMACAKCGTPVGVLHATDVSAPARVFLKTFFGKAKAQVMGSAFGIICPLCYSTKNE